jgi:hypothetical protein
MRNLALAMTCVFTIMLILMLNIQGRDSPMFKNIPYLDS